MAILKNNIITRGLSGMLGDVIVFRTLRGKTVMANKPRKPSRQSELQRTNRSRFRNATAFAHAAMKDPEKKAYYWTKARKLKLPNAYTAAITDYMRRPAVSKVDISKPNGNAHGHLVITASKKEFALSSVEVNFLDKEGISLGTNTATLKKPWKNEWISKPPIPLSSSVAAIMVIAKDDAGNISCVRHWREQNLLEAA